MTSRYSPELVNFVLHPLKLQQQRQKINVYDMLAVASHGLLAEVDSMYAHSDALEEMS